MQFSTQLSTTLQGTDDTITSLQGINMATYTELAQLFSVSTLKPQVTAAIAIAAQNIANEDPATPNYTERFTWAAKASSNPSNEANRFLIGVLAANSTATVEQIQNATDAAVQTNVDALVDLFALFDATLTT